jgi:protein-tyrosine phosphatase
LSAGITHCIDLRAEFNDGPLFAGRQVAYLWNPTSDDGKHKSPTWFGRSIVFALDALSHRHHKVYAHCAAGVNRGPSTCFAIMLALGFAPVDAELIIRKARPQVGLAYRDDAIAAIPALGYD